MDPGHRLVHTDTPPRSPERLLTHVPPPVRPLLPLHRYPYCHRSEPRSPTTTPVEVLPHRTCHLDECTSLGAFPTRALTLGQSPHKPTTNLYPTPPVSPPGPRETLPYPHTLDPPPGWTRTPRPGLHLDPVGPPDPWRHGSPDTGRTVTRVHHSEGRTLPRDIGRRFRGVSLLPHTHVHTRVHTRIVDTPLLR